MTTATSINPATTFTRRERSALRSLRARYRHDRDLFSPAELARLRFLRWLCQTNRLAP